MTNLSKEQQEFLAQSMIKNPKEFIVWFLCRFGEIAIKMNGELKKSAEITVDGKRYLIESTTSFKEIDNE